MKQFRQFERDAQKRPWLCALLCVLTLIPVLAYAIDGIPQSDWLSSGHADFRRAVMALTWFALSVFWGRLAWRGWRGR